MDFGRIEQLELVDFTLPNDHKSVARILGGAACAKPQVYVGGVRWASDSFPGSIYPPNARPADFVKHYTRQFNTIELNATHYRMPDAATLKRWYEAAPEGFAFCAKIHQEVSHAVNLADKIPLQQSHNQLLEQLGPKLGTVFMQLPPHFTPERLGELITFLDQGAMPGMAVELRHHDWFVKVPELNTLSNYLYKKGLGLVLTDTPGRRDVLHMRLTNKTAFVRFNAHNNYKGDLARVDDWVGRARQWFELGLERFYFFVHTPGQLFMPRVVMYFIERLEQVCGIRLQPPILL